MTNYSYATQYAPVCDNRPIEGNSDIFSIQLCFNTKKGCREKDCKLCVEDFFKLLPCKGIWLIGLALLVLVFGIASLGLGLEIDELVRIWLTGTEPVDMSELGVGVNVGLSVVTFLIGLFLIRTARGWSTVAIGSAVSSSAFAIAALGRVFVAYDSTCSNGFPFYLAGLVVLIFLWIAFLLSAICLAHCACCPEKEVAIASSIAYFAAGYATWILGGVIAAFIKIHTNPSNLDLILGPFYIILALSFVLIVLTLILAFRLIRSRCANPATILIGALTIVTPLTLLGFLRLTVLGFGGNLVPLTSTNVTTLLPFAYLLSTLCVLVLFIALAGYLVLLPFGWAILVLTYAVGQAIVPIIKVELLTNSNADCFASLQSLVRLLLNLAPNSLPTPNIVVEEVLSTSWIFGNVLLIVVAVILVSLALPILVGCDFVAGAVLGVATGTFGLAGVKLFSTAVFLPTTPVLQPVSVTTWWIWFGSILLLVLFIKASIGFLLIRCKHGSLAASFIFLTIALAAVGFGEFIGNTSSQMVACTIESAFLRTIIIALSFLLGLLAFSLGAPFIVVRCAKLCETAVSITLATVGTGFALRFLGLPISEAAYLLVAFPKATFLPAYLTTRVGATLVVTFAPQLLLWLFEPVYLTSAIASLAVSLSASGIARIILYEFNLAESPPTSYILCAVGTPVVLSIILYAFLGLLLEAILLFSKNKSKCYRFLRLLPAFVIPAYAFGVASSIIGGLSQNNILCSIPSCDVVAAVWQALLFYAVLVLLTLFIAFMLVLFSGQCLVYLASAIATIPVIMFVWQARPGSDRSITSVNWQPSLLWAFFRYLPKNSPICEWRFLAILILLLLAIPIIFSFALLRKCPTSRNLALAIASIAFGFLLLGLSNALGYALLSLWEDKDCMTDFCVLEALKTFLPLLLLDVLPVLAVISYLVWCACVGRKKKCDKPQSNHC